MRQTGESSPLEALVYTYWVTTLQLLKVGIPWEAIMSFTESEINMVVGVEAALEQRQNDEHAREMSRSNTKMPTNMRM